MFVNLSDRQFEQLAKHELIMYQQVKEFTEYGGLPEPRLNMFLREIGDAVISVTPLYNGKIGGIVYVVVYWCVYTK